MRIIIPRRRVIEHAFGVTITTHADHVTRLYGERFGPLDELIEEGDARPPAPPPIAEADARRHIRELLGLPADAAVCMTCWQDGYRTHGPRDRTHHFRGGRS